MTGAVEARIVIAVPVDSRNRRAGQDVTSQFDASSRTFAAAKGRLGAEEGDAPFRIYKWIHARTFRRARRTKSIIDSWKMRQPRHNDKNTWIKYTFYDTSNFGAQPSIQT